MISNCGKDERGSCSGGNAGDQTGQEWWVINWWDAGWCCALRHPNSKVCTTLADLALQAAENNNIGYDQSQRLTFWQALKNAEYEPKKICEPCEADCSSGVAALIKATGHILGIEALKDIPETLTTFNMRSALVHAGFTLLEGSKYVCSDDYLRAGDILLNDYAHVAIQVSTGSKAQEQVTIAIHPPEEESQQEGPKLPEDAERHSPMLMKGSGMNDPTLEVAIWQGLLNLWGGILLLGIMLDIDGEFGPRTDIATKIWQRAVGLEETGVVDDDDWEQAIKLPCGGIGA